MGPVEPLEDDHREKRDLRRICRELADVGVIDTCAI